MKLSCVSIVIALLFVATAAKSYIGRFGFGDRYRLYEGGRRGYGRQN